MNDFELLRAEKIVKRFPGVLALDDVSITINKGEIHCLLGENGAGKSTFIKILTGVYKSDGGKIFLENKEVKKITPEIALYDLKIIPIYQELSLAMHIPIYENIFLGNEKRKCKGLFINRKLMINATKRLFQELNQEINPKEITANLGVSKQQIVEIAKALSKNAKILILDEPTSSLGEKDSDNLFKILFKLKKLGISIIYITHKLDEVRKLADRVTVLRDGKKIITEDITKLTNDDIIKYMVGRELKNMFPIKDTKPDKEVIFEVKGITKYGLLRDISFKLYKGEILGIAGLVGSGRTELLKAIFGAYKVDRGSIFINNKRIAINHPKDSFKNGLALIVEDRKQEGLFLQQDVFFNVSIIQLNNYFPTSFIKLKRETNKVKELIEILKIKAPSLKTQVVNLSGGNQQKIVIAKWLNINPKIFLFDEPTRGIDVGAKYEIYNIINKIVKTGNSIIMVSSELNEILGVCDRILVMAKGKITGEFNNYEAHQEVIMKKMLEV